MKWGCRDRAASMVMPVARFISRMGPLRSVLAVVTVCLCALAPFALGGSEAEPSVLGILGGAVAPAVATLVAFLLPLDMTMSRVFMSGADRAEAARYARIIRCEAWLLASLLAAWVPTLVVALGAR